jgi:hypothetical protein
VVNGTCEWILDNDYFNSWLASKHEHLLWICGGPGKGKTFLSSFLVEMIPLITKREEPSANPLILEFYCDNTNGLRNTAFAVLLSCLHQLLESENSDEELHDRVHARLNDSHTDMFSKIPRQDLWDIFRQKASPRQITLEEASNKGQRQIYLVLDGLDECDAESIKFLTHNLEMMCSPGRQQGKPTFKAIIVSRPLARPFQTKFKLDLDAPENKEKTLQDIRRLIRWKVEHSERMSLEESELEKFESILSKRSNGTFLWVALAIDILDGDYVTVKKIVDGKELELLDRLLPTGLHPMYRRMLTGALEGKRTGGNNFRREDAGKIIRSISVAFRPLTEVELQVATGLDSADVSAHLHNCRHLLVSVQDEINNVSKFQLVHLSFREYLQHVPFLTLTTPTGPFLQSLASFVDWTRRQSYRLYLADHVLLATVLLHQWKCLIRFQAVGFFLISTGYFLLKGRNQSLVIVLLTKVLEFLLECHILAIFVINPTRAHAELFTKCLETMQRDLKRDICELGRPSALASDKAPGDLEKYLPRFTQYACRFWVDHARKSENQSENQLLEGVISSFLKLHFLHWLEALGLMGEISAGLAMVRTLQNSFTKVSVCCNAYVLIACPYAKAYLKHRHPPRHCFTTPVTLSRTSNLS